jgi:hypothetical protein
VLRINKYTKPNLASVCDIRVLVYVGSLWQYECVSDLTTFQLWPHSVQVILFIFFLPFPFFFFQTFLKVISSKVLITYFTSEKMVSCTVHMETTHHQLILTETWELSHIPICIHTFPQTITIIPWWNLHSWHLWFKLPTQCHPLIKAHSQTITLISSQAWTTIPCLCKLLYLSRDLILQHQDSLFKTATDSLHLCHA